MTRDPTEKEHAFLCMLVAGEDFDQAATVMGGNDALRVPWQCLLNGWIDRGRITKAGRELALRPCRTTKFQITILPSDSSALTSEKERRS